MRIKCKETKHKLLLAKADILGTTLSVQILQTWSNHTIMHVILLSLQWACWRYAVWASVTWTILQYKDNFYIQGSNFQNDIFSLAFGNGMWVPIILNMCRNQRGTKMLHQWSSISQDSTYTYMPLMAAPHVCSPGSWVGIRVNRSTKAGDNIY